VTAAHLEPAHVEEELEEGEEREEQVSAVTSARTLLERLTTHQTGEEEQVHGHGDYLYIAIQVHGHQVHGHRDYLYTAIPVHGHGDHLYIAIQVAIQVHGHRK